MCHGHTVDFARAIQLEQDGNLGWKWDFHQEQAEGRVGVSGGGAELAILGRVGGNEVGVSPIGTGQTSAGIDGTQCGGISVGSTRLGPSGARAIAIAASGTNGALTDVGKSCGHGIATQGTGGEVGRALATKGTSRTRQTHRGRVAGHGG